MCFTRKFKLVSALLIAAACVSQNSAPAAGLKSAGRSKAVRTSKAKTKNFPRRIQRAPRISGLSAKSSKSATKARPVGTARRTTQVTPPKLKKIKSAKPRQLTPSVGSPLAKSGRSTRAIKGSGVSSVRPKGTKFNNIAERAGNIRTKVADQAVRDLNSSSARAIDAAVPGFAGRGTKGAKGLKDLGSSGGNQRNPVTKAGDLKDFAGGGVGELSKGGKNNGTTAIHNPDNSTTLIKKNGERTDVLEDGTIVVTSPNKSQHIYPTEGPSWVYIPPKDGKDHDMVKYLKTQNKKGGTKGEPVDDPTGSGGSGEAVITADTLRGIRSRVSSKGEPTGDEASSGGALDHSKTRQGRIGQRGRPTDETVTIKSPPTTMEVNQALRIRLRNVNPVPR